MCFGIDPEHVLFSLVTGAMRRYFPLGSRPFDAFLPIGGAGVFGLVSIAVAHVVAIVSIDSLNPWGL